MNKPRTLNILLVDDRPENLLVLEELLAGEGRRFLRATSGQEALRYVLKGAIGLILLDVQMPDMDGFEVASLLKGNPTTREIPIIFMTAISKEEKYALQGYVGGAIDYLYKPLNADITRAKIQVFEELFHRQEDLKAANAELTRVNLQLEDLNTQKNYLLGMAAHDLRNPIGAIAQLSQILLTAGAVTNEQSRFLTAIRESSDYILRIIEDLLDVSKIESGKMSLDIQPTDVRALLARSLSIHRLIADKKDIRIELTENLHTAYLYMDAIKIEQVLGNLLSNAIKFSPRGTAIVVYSQEQNDQLVISVRDQGPGIPADEQHKLFKGFQTTSVRPTEGEKSTGLGLLICAKIVQAHGGAIHVQSAPGAGSTFWFTIPVTMAESALGGDLPRIRESAPFGLASGTPAASTLSAAGLSASPPGHPRIIAAGKTILVVEDDKVAQLVVKKVLGRMGYQAVVTDGAEEALELLGTTDVGMVFMDVHLPGISGIEATRRIRALTDPRKQNVPVVGLTASRAEEEIEECLRAGMNICIKKPVMVAELMKTLETP
ncbi:MAG TPA: response regulator [Dinghuibacter sp.]|uniref:hybrid sensor histidine kinase/response regulator n=1 Tax=Dinghuibacter sp. TaxID=2024697 RepID=UPI002B7CDB90|nr:response regulator [Dinghuibacter sp.]HTJ13929.1 response regulator [Dinghuibacter sp.]